MADNAPPAEPAAAAKAESTAPPVVVASAVPAGIRSGVSTPGGPRSGAVTPAMSELPADQVGYSLKVSLADLCAKAAMLYSQQKNYEEAAEVYARAAEMQAEINGEMDPENAEILFLYGRALFKVGQSKSDVLGGKAPETSEDAKKAPKAQKDKKESAAGGSGIIAKAIGGASDSDPVASASSGATKEEAAALEAKKPLFQFTGDEEWDASDDEAGEDAAGGDDDGEGDEEEEDDLAVAFEVLDLSRVLFERQLEEKKDKEGATDTGAEAEGLSKGKEVEESKADGDEAASPIATGVSGDLRHVLERLADTHDLLAEISLENERYPNAIVDSRASLAYKKRYLSEDSEIIAEAHFKLSLALEFASVTTASEDSNNGHGNGNGAAADGGQQQTQQVDQELRDEAARELEAAIASTKLKLQSKEVELATLHSPEDNDSTRRQITEVKDIISDMEQRLVDLRKPPIDLNAAVNGPAGAGLGGLLGALSGGAAGGFGGASGSGSGSAVGSDAKKPATDLTGLVRKKAKDVPAPAALSADASSTNGKRKAEEPADGSDEEAKKARTVDAA
ncbi:HAT1-interacting factor 1 [Sporothrix schenckii 1099-18]|uniref:HAT1-interacting factor 1 n=1 Tax=Sporothrix schenckii 1099-18 TaxID=1397361 RepID=A0A0F2MJU8_SPOSC|nr:HAT1-interacting factor 1 [Sporothrix schenckii 1099-18]KJR89110.1 HAT1-interacting factor 1 [Sporothrix schenckii 1099-18]